MDNLILDDNIYGNDIQAQPQMAGFWIRVGASLVDFLVYLPFVAINMYNLYYLKSFALSIIILVMLAIYKPIMEYKYGATLGKMAVKIKVVNKDFERITIGESILRYSPWLLGQIISLFTNVILFLNAGFIDAKGLREVGLIQNELVSPALSYTSSTILLISCLIIVFNSKKQGGHDLIANTYCIYR